MACQISDKDSRYAHLVGVFPPHGLDAVFQRLFGIPVFSGNKAAWPFKFYLAVLCNLTQLGYA